MKNLCVTDEYTCDALAFDGARMIAAVGRSAVLAQIGSQHGATQYVGLRFDLQVTRFLGDFSFGLSDVRKIGAVWPKAKVNCCVGP